MTEEKNTTLIVTTLLIICFLWLLAITMNLNTTKNRLDTLENKTAILAPVNVTYYCHDYLVTGRSTGPFAIDHPQWFYFVNETTYGNLSFRHKTGQWLAEDVSVTLDSDNSSCYAITEFDAQAHIADWRKQ